METLHGCAAVIAVPLLLEVLKDRLPLLGGGRGDIDDCSKKVRSSLVVPDSASRGVRSHLDGFIRR